MAHTSKGNDFLRQGWDPPLRSPQYMTKALDTKLLQWYFVFISSQDLQRQTVPVVRVKCSTHLGDQPPDRYLAMNTHQQQALNTLLSFTKLSRAIACVLVATYVVQLIAPASRQYTALVAGRFIPCAWSVFTAGILETHLLKVGL